MTIMTIMTLMTIMIIMTIIIDIDININITTIIISIVQTLIDSPGKPQSPAVILDTLQQVYDLWMVGLYEDIYIYCTLAFPIYDYLWYKTTC
jgi:hypothetical protein